jgi:protein-S-isoprenylcysteine O-methyltransferase Ste14
MRRAILGTLVGGAVLALALFASARTWDWPMAWAVLAVYAAISIAGLVLLPADLLAERSTLPSDTQPRDLLIAGSALVFLLPATLVVCGLDARRQWSPPLPAGLRLFALAVLALGYALSLWAAWSNPFFSSVVRVQRERGHRVVASGPYAFVRHPGYAGPIAAHLGLPIALGSLWGLLPALLGCALVVVRLRYEERVLSADLPGYRDYVQRVPWRLLPRVW